MYSCVTKGQRECVYTAHVKDKQVARVLLGFGDTTFP